MKIRIGTRNSKLALIQTQLVVNKLSALFPDIECIIVPVVTTGDKITDKNLYDIGGKALFLKELEEELLSGKIDIAVHSLKDVPGILPKGLEIAAVLERDNPLDCFISFGYKSINHLPMNATIGSSSVRRKILINKIRPDLKVVQFRGNIDTRLEKLRKNEVDATILACAGLSRANLFDSSYCFPILEEQMLPAVGQGVIAIETRSDNHKIQGICKTINHAPTWFLSQVERSFLSFLDANCRTPIAAYAKFLADSSDLIPFPILNQTNEFQGEAAQLSDLGEHTQDLQNSFVSFKMGNGIIKVKYMLSNISGTQVEFLEEIIHIKDIDESGRLAATKLKKRFKNYEEEVRGE